MSHFFYFSVNKWDKWVILYLLLPYSFDLLAFFLLLYILLF
nr:MAG TPA: hypothetical protein [Caudoviricetes sp.]